VPHAVSLAPAGKNPARRATPAHKAPQVLREPKASKAWRARRDRREHRDHKALRGHRVKRKRRATRVTGAIPAPQTSALSKRMALWPARPMRRGCRYSAQVAVRRMERSATRHRPWDFASRNSSSGSARVETGPLIRAARKGVGGLRVRLSGRLTQLAPTYQMVPTETAGTGATLGRPN
jgi:hypothetical protein